jgi:DinB superfamily
MPEYHYAFVPCAGVRTFGEQVRHIATLNYMSAAIINDTRSPYGPGDNDNGPAEMQSKAEVIEFLNESLAFAQEAMTIIDGPRGAETVQTYFGFMPRAQVAAGLIFHSFNHYGQMVIYARMCGIAPSSLF